jgi:hypothetical protein
MRLARSCVGLVLLGGCTPSSESAESLLVTSEVVDSAGVRIVTNRAPAWSTGAAWSVDSTPRVSIGVVEGDEAYMLFRVSSATRLANGSVAIGNSGTREVRVYGPDGTHVRTIGRDGDGPGEFRAVSQLYASSGDTLVVWDGTAFRISRFDSDGELVGEQPIDRGKLLPTFKMPLVRLSLRVLRNGELMGDLNYMGNSGAESDPAPGTYFRPQVAVVRAAVDLSRWDTIGMQAGMENAQFMTGGPMGVLPMFPPYQRSAVLTTGDRSSRICAGDQSTAEISCYAPDGARTSIRWPATPLPVSAGEIDAWREQRIEALTRSGEQGIDVRKMVMSTPVPETREPYDRIFLDLPGNLWVEHAPPLLDAEDPAPAIGMSVFDADGRWLGDVTLPPMTPLEIGDDYVIGRQQDENDVEYVRVWTLRKPTGS